MTDTTATIKATTLGCSLTCKNLDASIRSYRDGLGFAVTQTFENAGNVVAAVVVAGDRQTVRSRYLLPVPSAVVFRGDVTRGEAGGRV